MDIVTVGYIAYKAWKWLRGKDDTDPPEPDDAGGAGDDFANLLF